MLLLSSYAAKLTSARLHRVCHLLKPRIENENERKNPKVLPYAIHPSQFRRDLEPLS